MPTMSDVFAQEPFSTSNTATDFTLNLILIFFTVGTGAATTKLVANSWQKRALRSDIKRTVLNEYANSYKYQYAILELFIERLFMEYCSEGIEQQGTVAFHKEDNIENYFKYVKFTNNKKPSLKFGEEFKELTDNFFEATHEMMHFSSSLRLYYRNDDLVTESHELRNDLIEALNFVRKFMYSNTPREFIDNYKSYDIVSHEVIIKLRDYEVTLVNAKFHKKTL